MDTRCKYASKPCSNTRSLKDNGDYHILCDFHRDKANQAQRRWYLRNAPDGKSAKRTATSKEQTDPKPARRPRKVTSPANATVLAPLRKRGSVTFRNNSVREAVLAATHPLSPSVIAPQASYLPDPCAVIPAFQPYQQPLLWIDVAFEQVNLDDKWPVPVPLESPNDIALMSLFSSVGRSIDSAGTVEWKL